MATVDLTLEQIHEAIEQLPVAQRLELLERIATLSSAEESLETARRIRHNFSMDATKQDRLSELLNKNRENTLTVPERRELDALVDQTESNMLELARALLRGKSSD